MLGLSIRASARRTAHALRSSPEAAPTALATLLAEPAAIAVWDASDRARMSQARNIMVPVTSDGQPMGRLADCKGALDLVAPGDAQRPLSPALFDGVDDQLRLTFPGGSGPARGDLVLGYRGTDGRAILVASQGNVYAGVLQDDGALPAIGNAGATDLLLDGVSMKNATRIQFNQAASDGQSHIVELRGVQLNQFEYVRFGHYLGFEVAGLLVPLALLDTAHPEIASARLAAFEYAEGVMARLGD